jgi:ribA/ribD-fused uncharacterized protein
VAGDALWVRDVSAVAAESSLNAYPDLLIDWFDDFAGPQPYSFLSNFHEGHPVRWRGHTFATTEAAFAWEKVDPDHRDFQLWRNKIKRADNPGTAKMLGRRCPLDPAWEQRKFDVMYRVVWQKFAQHPDLAAALDDTGIAYLQEGTFWNDRCWGVDLTSSENPWKRAGMNWLGLILMDVRHKRRNDA